MSFDQARIHNSSLDTSVSYIVYIHIYYIYTYPCLCYTPTSPYIKTMYQFRGIRRDRKVDEGEEATEEKEKRKGEKRVHEGGKKTETSVYLNLNFEFYRWHMVPWDGTIGVPWSAIGCSFRSRRPSIFEEDRPKVSRGTPSTPRPFPNVSLSVYICIQETAAPPSL